MSRVQHVPLAEHAARLHRTRDTFLKELRGISRGEWRRLRRPPDVDEVNYEVTPEWAVFHLVEHEAGHAYQIRSLKAQGLADAGGREGVGKSRALRLTWEVP